MRTIGSLSLCRSLLRAGLVDRFRVVIFPVMTGKTGRERIYDGYPDVALDMLASRTFDGKIQLVEYVPLVLEGPPLASATLDLNRGRRARDPAPRLPVQPAPMRAGTGSLVAAWVAVRRRRPGLVASLRRFATLELL
jgi:hypothetical protein